MHFIENRCERGKRLMFPTNETTISMHYAVCDKETYAELKSNVCGFHPHFFVFLLGVYLVSLQHPVLRSA